MTNGQYSNTYSTFHFTLASYNIKVVWGIVVCEVVRVQEAVAYICKQFADEHEYKVIFKHC